MTPEDSRNDSNSNSQAALSTSPINYNKLSYSTINTFSNICSIGSAIGLYWGIETALRARRATLDLYRITGLYPPLSNGLKPTHVLYSGPGGLVPLPPLSSLPRYLRPTYTRFAGRVLSRALIGTFFGSLLGYYFTVWNFRNTLVTETTRRVSRGDAPVFWDGPDNGGDGKADAERLKLLTQLGVVEEVKQGWSQSVQAHQKAEKDKGKGERGVSMTVGHAIMRELIRPVDEELMRREAVMRRRGKSEGRGEPGGWEADQE